MSNKMVSINDEVIKSLRVVVDTFWSIEFNDWEDKDNPEEHVFHFINNIKNWLIAYDNERLSYD